MTCQYAREVKQGRMELLACHCDQHMFEVQHLPQACAENWPTAINFEKLSEHVESLYDELLEVVGDPMCSCFGTHKTGKIFGQEWGVGVGKW